MPLPATFRDFRTYITIVSLSIGVIGLYHYYESVQERLPTYYVSPTRARIVDTSIPAPPQLQVLYRGKDLNANVSAATVYLWNAGKLPLKAEDVLEPVKIDLEPGCEIIDARILKTSRSVTKFAKGEISETAKNSLPVSFALLERNDGAAVQIIYSGKPNAAISVAGTILGAGHPHRLVPPDATIPPTPERSLTGLTVIAIFLVLMSAGFLVSAVESLRKRQVAPGIYLLVVGAFILVLLFFLLRMLFVATNSPTIPPSIWSHT